MNLFDKYWFNKKKKIIFIFLLSLFLLNFIYSSDYYLDSNIQIFNDGSVNINSITNLDYLKNISHSQKYTSKKEEYWIFNLTTNEVFSEYIYELTLPENSQINYIKTTPNIRFENENNKIKIIGIGNHMPLEILIQYKILNPIDFNLINYNRNFQGDSKIITIIGITSILLIIVLSVIIFILIKNINKIRNNLNNIGNKTNLNNRNNGEDNKLNNNLEKVYELLSERQKEIINILKEKEKITQKELEKIMEIPKSSISRNIRTLEIKSIIVKERVGNTNYIFLNNKL